MPFVNPFGNKNTLPNTITFTLTPLGTVRAGDYNGDTESQILVALQENGPSNASEICAQTGLSRNKVVGVLLRSRKEGKVHSIRGDDS